MIHFQLIANFELKPGYFCDFRSNMSGSEGVLANLSGTAVTHGEFNHKSANCCLLRCVL